MRFLLDPVVDYLEAAAAGDRAVVDADSEHAFRAATSPGA